MMKNWKMVVSAVLVGTMAFSVAMDGFSFEKKTVKAETSYGISSPRVHVREREVVKFGTYWQNDTNKDGAGTTKDTSSDIYWHVIKKDSDKVVLLSQKVLDFQAFDENVRTTTSWKDSTIRKWLNNYFFNAAFTPSEREKILENEHENYRESKVSLNYRAYKEESTTDKVYLLSADEFTGAEYGFLYNEESTTNFDDQARYALFTDYATTKYKSVNSVEPFYDMCYTRTLNFEGKGAVVLGRIPFRLDNHPYNGTVGGGIRPVIEISLADYEALSYKQKGAIAVDGTEWDSVKFGTKDGKDLLWKVLNVTENDAFLMLDNYLDLGAFHDSTQNEYITWENCDMRENLRDFYKSASFNDKERNAIIETTVTSQAIIPPEKYMKDIYTKDKIYILSSKEVTSKAYGFPQKDIKNALRSSEESLSDNYFRWCLRNVTNNADYTGGCDYVDYLGVVKTGKKLSASTYVYPVLHLDLSKTDVWEKGDKIVAGDISSKIVYVDNNAEVTENPGTTANPTMDPNATPTPKPTYEPGPISTEKPIEPTGEPIEKPTYAPKPTDEPGVEPTMDPDATPAVTPTAEPVPTVKPSTSTIGNARLDLDEGSYWTTLLSRITYETYRWDIQATVTSPAKKVYYWLDESGTDKPLTLEQLDAIQNWTEYRAPFRFFVPRAIVYVKAVDGDKVSYICTGGMNFVPYPYELDREDDDKVNEVQLVKPVLKVSNMRNYKASTVKKKKRQFTLKVKTNSDGKFSFKNVTKSSKLKKYFSVSKTGKVTLKKGAKKGTYQVKVSVAETDIYKKASKTIKIKVK